MRITRFPLAVVALPTLLLLTGCQPRQSSLTTTEATPTTPSRPADNRETASPPIIPSARDNSTAPWDPRFFELTLDQSRPTFIATPPPTLTKFPASERTLHQALPRLDRPGDDVVYRWIQQRRGGGLDLIDNQH